nr:hypothetical protein Itr_chr01CG19890 [Ipomoea trifida]
MGQQKFNNAIKYTAHITCMGPTRPTINLTRKKKLLKFIDICNYLLHNYMLEVFFFKNILVV